MSQSVDMIVFLFVSKEFNLRYLTFTAKWINLVILKRGMSQRVVTIAGK